MNKLLKFLSLSLLLVGALYIGVKGVIYFKVKSQLDDAIAMAGPFVEVEYGGISSGLDGRISIEDIGITPPGLGDRLQVDALSVQWPHIGYLFSGTGAAPAQMRELPPKMTLVLEGLHLPTTGPLADSFHMQQKQRLAGLSTAGETPDACGLYGTFGGEDYSAIGYDELILDASFGFELNEADPEAVVHLDYRMRGMQTLSMDLTLTGIRQPAAMMMGVIPQLKEYTASFRADPGFTARVISYCAALRNQSKEEYIRAVASETGGGFVPGAGMRRAIKRFLENPSEVLISMRPAQPLDVTTLVHYRPEDIVALLGLQIQVGGEKLQDLSFDLSVPKGSGGARPGPGQTPGTAGLDIGSVLGGPGVVRGMESAGQRPPVVAGTQRRNSGASRPQRRYLTTRTKDLKRYVGQDVRLFTHAGEKPRSGVLVSVKDGQAHVEQRIHSGTMTTHVPMAEIKTAEVFRLPGQD